MMCEMRCLMSVAHLAIERGRLEKPPPGCPTSRICSIGRSNAERWSIPGTFWGLAASTACFPPIENSVPDHRVDELLDMMSDIFILYIRILTRPPPRATRPCSSICETARRAGAWWDRFASTEVEAIEGVSGQETLESAEKRGGGVAGVAEGGAAAGDVAFWRRHVEHFRVPKAYALVIDTLLDRRDFGGRHGPVGPMAQSGREIPLVEEDFSFHDLAMSWMEDLWQASGEGSKAPNGERATDADSSLPSRSEGKEMDTAAMDADAEVPRLPRSQRRRVLVGSAV